ncbi:MAG: YciI family protein [Actinomycetota bacterium]|nr:YciI family protein [Actinomycetota bacterium]
MLYANEEEGASLADKLANDVSRKHAELAQDMSGNVLSCVHLRPSFTATSVRHSTAGVEVADGTVIEAEESLSGIYIIQALNLDEALAIAKQVPPPWSAVEVRPLCSETA